jgi:hypothetical protein
MGLKFCMTEITFPFIGAQATALQARLFRFSPAGTADGALISRTGTSTFAEPIQCRARNHIRWLCGATKL